MTKTKNAKGAGRPSEIAGAVLWRGYISQANYNYLAQDGPRQMSARLRRVLDAAEAGTIDSVIHNDALFETVKGLQSQVARLERELAAAETDAESLARAITPHVDPGYVQKALETHKARLERILKDE